MTTPREALEEIRGYCLMLPHPIPPSLLNKVDAALAAQPELHGASCTAADGVTPVVSVTGQPLLVSALAFNDLFYELQRLKAEKAQPELPQPDELAQAQATQEPMSAAEFFAEARRLNLKLNPSDFDLSEESPK